MKNTITVSVFALSLLMAACGNDTTTSTTTTDSSMNMDTQPQASATPPADAMNAMSDQDFVTQASAANMAEVSAHKAAQTHAVTADVKMHAKHMLADHQKLGDDMKALATQKGLTVSADAPADKKQMLDDMNANKKGKDWDMAYLDQQVKDHQEAIALFERGSASVQDADLKALIDKTLPTLRSHLQMVQDAQGKMNQQ